MNITNISNLISQKKYSKANDTFSKTNDALSFNQVLNNEKKGLMFNKKDNLKQTPSEEYYATGNKNKDLNKPDIQSNQIDEFNKHTNDLSTKESNKLDIYEETDIEISEEDLNNECLNNIISLLQDLITNFNTDQMDTENNIDVNLDLSNIEIEGLDNLKDVLKSLLNNQNVDVDQLMKENIEKAISTITQIVDHSSLSNNDIVSVDKEAIVNMLNTLKDLKDNPSVILNNMGSSENNIQQNIAFKQHNNLLLEEEKIQQDDNVLSHAVDINVEDETKTKIPAKTLLENFSEGQDFVKQQESPFENLVVTDNFIASQQEKIDQTINLNIIKNEIVEPKQFISEIAQKASAFLSKDKNEMNIQLTPENLGKISIKIGLNDGTLTGKIYAENYSVKEIIEANLNQLRDALEESGLNIGGLEVNIGHNSQEFGNRMFKQSSMRRQKPKEESILINNSYITLDQESNQVNPYLITGKFDGLV